MGAGAFALLLALALLSAFAFASSAWPAQARPASIGDRGRRLRRRLAAALLLAAALGLALGDQRHRLLERHLERAVLGHVGVGRAVLDEGAVAADAGGDLLAVGPVGAELARGWPAAALRRPSWAGRAGRPRGSGRPSARRRSFERVGTRCCAGCRGRSGRCRPGSACRSRDAADLARQRQQLQRHLEIELSSGHALGQRGRAWASRPRAFAELHVGAVAARLQADDLVRSPGRRRASRVALASRRRRAAVSTASGRV